MKSTIGYQAKHRSLSPRLYCQTTTESLLCVLLKQDNCIVPPKPKICTHGSINLHLPLFIWDIIQITVGIRCFIIDCWWNHLILNGSRRNNSLQSPSCSQRMSRYTLGTRNGKLAILLRGMLTKYRFECHRLKLIIVRRRRSMSIDIVNIRLIHATLINCHFHRSRQSPSLWRRCGNVVSIARGTISHHFAVNIRSSCQCTVQRLKHYHTGTLAHDEPTPIGIKGTRSPSWIIIVLDRHGLHTAESGVTQWGDGGLGTARDHLISISIGNHAEGFADGVGGRGAGGGNAVVGAFAAAFDADDSGGGVSKESGDGEGRYLGPFRLLMQLQNFPLKRFRPPKCGTYEHTTPLRILQRLWRIPQLGILQRQPCRCHGKMRKSIITLGILGIGEVILWIEHFIRNFGTDFTWIMRWIEAGDGAETGDAIDAILEEVFVTDSAAADDT
mmetsp:Transcript_20236/g.44003  ORF Transcript_20236/g.44003 Transcript_20236/m.44003 type:complete len:443 (+) Transcript_20236:1318-2646(+)